MASSLDWPLSKDEKKHCVIKFYERELRESDEEVKRCRLISTIARDKERFQRMSQELGSIGSESPKEAEPEARKVEEKTEKEETAVASPEKTPEASKALQDTDGRRVASMGSRRFEAQDDSPIWQKSKSKSMSAIPTLPVEEEEQQVEQAEVPTQVEAKPQEGKNADVQDAGDVQRQLEAMRRTIEQLQLTLQIQQGHNANALATRDESEEPVSGHVEIPIRGRSEPRLTQPTALRNPGRPRRRSRGGDALSVRFAEEQEEAEKQAARGRGRSGFDEAAQAAPSNGYDAAPSNGYESTAAVLGVSGGLAGFSLGTTVGAAVGVGGALFTFGLSIPIGAAIGGTCGTVGGAAAGLAAPSLWKSGSSSNLHK